MTSIRSNLLVNGNWLSEMAPQELRPRYPSRAVISISTNRPAYAMGNAYTDCHAQPRGRASN